MSCHVISVKMQLPVCECPLLDRHMFLITCYLFLDNLTLYIYSILTQRTMWEISLMFNMLYPY